MNGDFQFAFQYFACKPAIKCCYIEVNIYNFKINQHNKYRLYFVIEDFRSSFHDKGPT